MSVTIRDVAEAAGVSIATVSRVLNHKDHPVSDETRQRIFMLADEMGYRPNLAARSLRTDRSATVGIIADDIIGLANVAAIGLFGQRPHPARGGAIRPFEIFIKHAGIAGPFGIDHHVKALFHLPRAALEHAPAIERTVEIGFQIKGRLFGLVLFDAGRGAGREAEGKGSCEP